MPGMNPSTPTSRNTAATTWAAVRTGLRVVVDGLCWVMALTSVSVVGAERHGPATRGQDGQTGQVSVGSTAAERAARSAGGRGRRPLCGRAPPLDECLSVGGRTRRGAGAR